MVPPHKLEIAYAHRIKADALHPSNVKKGQTHSVPAFSTCNQRFVMNCRPANAMRQVKSAQSIDYHEMKPSLQPQVI